MSASSRRIMLRAVVLAVLLLAFQPAAGGSTSASWNRLVDLFGPESAWAHNLQTRMVYMFFDIGADHGSVLRHLHAHLS